MHVRWFYFRLFVEALAMTGADLSATSKPWDLQMITVKTIYEEFYNQGDCEIKHGRQPVPIMNRHYIDQQSLHQVHATFSWHAARNLSVDFVASLFSKKMFLGRCWKGSGLESNSIVWQGTLCRSGIDAGKWFLSKCMRIAVKMQLKLICIRVSKCTDSNCKEYSLKCKKLQSNCFYKCYSRVCFMTKYFEIYL